MGIGFGAALSLVAVVGFVVLAWVVFAVVALVPGGWRGQWTRSQRHTTRATVIHK
jgi:large-conductance mechanosensitive channel